MDPFDITIGRLVFFSKDLIFNERDCVVCQDVLPAATKKVGLFYCDCSIVIHEVCLFNYCAANATVKCPICKADAAAICIFRDTVTKTVKIQKELVPSGAPFVHEEEEVEEAAFPIVEYKDDDESGIEDAKSADDSDDSSFVISGVDVVSEHDETDVESSEDSKTQSSSLLSSPSLANSSEKLEEEEDIDESAVVLPVKRKRNHA